MELETVIGLEVHVELSTNSKLFCGCPNRFGAEPNSLVCPVCLGLPGVLPVVNRKAIELHLEVARALGCQIAHHSKFDRKNYFYPDMPKNFQTSQYDLPLAHGGWVELSPDRVIGLTRIHLEEDTGKSIHYREIDGELVPGRLGGSDVTLVDYNRAGVPLLEIVSEPDIRTSDEAQQYVQTLRDVILWLGASDCRMEQGSLRCDANVSLRPRGQKELGTKTEIKNMNSFKSIAAAIDYEVERQAELLSRGEAIVQETRGWDETRGLTIGMRSKEEAHDYRYFPEPDLPLLEISPAWIKTVDESLPELPAARRERYLTVFEGLEVKEASYLTQTPFIGSFFEQTVEGGAEPAEVVKWMTNEISRVSNETETELQESRLTTAALAETLALVKTGKVSAKGAQKMVEHLFKKGGQPAQVMEQLGLLQLSDESQLRPVLEEVVAANPEVVREYREGKKKAFNVLVGQTMKKTRGRANPKTVNQLLKEILDASQ